MKKWNRRELLRDSLLGLTTIGAGVFALEDALAPTPAHGELGEYGEFLLARGESPDAPPRSFDPTDADARGPFYKKGAPFRGRVAPEDAPGTPMLIRGRVYGREARKALDGAVIDVWQADAGGRYHGMDEKENFRYRARMRSAQGGFYRFETVHPGRYGSGFWRRPSHIHFYVRHPDYRPLVTQLYFEGDPRLSGRERSKPSLIIPLRQASLGKKYETGRFDIVLTKG